MEELASYELEGGIATIAMDDGKVNALSISMLERLHECLDRAEKDEAVVILTGREGYLSAGFDLRVFQEEPERIVEMLLLGARLSERLLCFPTPVIVACSGHAIAAGTFAALSADLRIGVEGAFKLGLNEVKIGLTVPLFVVELARQRLTPAEFNRALGTARMYSPEEAVDAGLLDLLVAPAELASASRAAAEQLAGLNMAAHTATKLRVRESALRALRAAIETELEAHQNPA
jgi:enoyl-CoA hydratase